LLVLPFAPVFVCCADWGGEEVRVGEEYDQEYYKEVCG
jgi:hypothetical protein